MILSFLFNPSKMDNGLWLTVSGFTMAVLIFLMSIIFGGIEKSRTSKKDEFDSTRFLYGTIWTITSIIFFCTILGILFFIFDNEKYGAPLMVIILIFTMIFVPLLPLSYKISENFMEKRILRKIKKEIQPTIKFPRKKK